MAIEKNIIIGADLSGLEKKLDELIEALKASQKQADKTAESINDIADTTKDIGKSAETSKKGIKSLGAGFKGLGIAIKAAGIGLLLEGFRILKDLFDNNQKVVDAFSTSFNFLAGIFSEVSGVLEDVYNNVAQSSENFDALGRVLKNILTVAIVPVQLAFQGIRAAVLGAQLAWEQSYFGGNDAQHIEELKGQLEETRLKVVEIGEGALAAGKSIANDIGEAIQEVGTIGTEVVNGLKKIDAGAVLDNARAMTKLNKEAEIAEVLAQGLIEKYDRQAEKLRQIRDDETLTIEQRKKANEDLGKVLDEQEQVMLANAQRVVDAKAAILDKEKDNIEFQKEYIQATNELAGIEAQVDGFRSEYKMNQNALDREAIDLLIAKAETEQEVAEIEAEAAIEAELNAQKQLTLEQELNKKLYQSRLEALKFQKSLYKEGTQAYQDMVSQINVLNAERTVQEGEEARKRHEVNRASIEGGLQMATDALSLLSLRNENFDEEDEVAAKKAFDRNKKLQIAQAIINTSQAVMAQLAVPQDALTGQNFVKAGIAAATGAAQIAKIKSTEFESAGSVDTAIGNLTAAATSPQFNMVGSTGQNAILESLQRNPVRAYVVGSDVTSQQQLDRNRINQVSFP